MSLIAPPFNLSQWKMVLNALPHPVALTRFKEGIDGRSDKEILFLNTAFQSVMGYQVEDVLNNRIWAKKAYPDKHYRQYTDELWSDTLLKARETDACMIAFPTKITCKNGREKWFQISSHVGFPLYNELDLVSFVEIESPESFIIKQQALAVDLIQKQAEFTLKERQLNEIQAIAQIGSWELDINSGKAVWSKEMYHILGEDSSIYHPTFDDFLKKLATDQDRDRVKASLAKGIETRKKQQVKVQLIRPDGKSIYLSIFGQAIIDSKGLPIRMVGTTQDITATVLAQSALKNQNLLLSNIIDSVPARVYWLDAKGVFQGANNLFLQDAQISSVDALVGATVDDLIWASKYDEVYKNDDLKVMTTGESLLFTEYDELDEQGQRVVWLTSRVVLKGPEGDITGMLCMYEDITQRRLDEEALLQQKVSLHHQAHHDALTNLPNRLLFQDELKAAISEGRQSGRSFAVLFIDLDRFKQINDTLGHYIGDEVLKKVACRLSKHIKKEDCLARLGGDEFIILLSSLEGRRDISKFTQGLLEDIRRVIQIGEESFYLSCSIGVSLYPSDSDSAESLLKFADTAMYRAKEQGRNNIQFYTEDMTHSAFEHLAMQSSLRQAIKMQEFIVYYQPQVNARTHTLIGMEALVRWQHPSMGLVAPNHFIALAEEMGFIVELDRLVMIEAMQQMARWYGAGMNPGVLSLNLSPKQLLEPDFMAFVINALIETGCTADWFEFEITENILMDNLEVVKERLIEIKALGILISIDDFGTGYSSLAYLKGLPIGKLKIDRAFVKDLPNDEEDAVITQTIIMMAHNLGMKVIAEGVETAEQRDFLLELGCEYIQGYFYGKPMPAAEFIEHVSKI